MNIELRDSIILVIALAIAFGVVYATARRNRK